MDRPAQSISRRTAAWRVGRWLLVASVMAGVVAMHVLSEHDAGGGHGMGVVNLHAASGPGAIAAASGNGRPSDPMGMAMSDAAVWASTAPVGYGMSGSMSTCILFLVVGAALALIALLAVRRRDRNTRLRTPHGVWARSLRGPPGPRPPRVSLCVLRV